MGILKVRVIRGRTVCALFCLAMATSLFAQNNQNPVQIAAPGNAPQSAPATTAQSTVDSGGPNSSDLLPDDSTAPGVAPRRENNGPSREESKRILWIIPNFRTSPIPQNYEPLTTGEKFKVAGEDAWDRGTVALAVVFAAKNQWTNGNRAFGQGVAGYGQYLGASYGDWVIGDYMTEAIFPTILHQDPRYFRRGTGSGLSRLGYAIGQTFWTHSDSGRMQFNYSEFAGNSTAVAISMAYYKDNRTVSDATTGLGWQIGLDMASNVLKEFWPDLERKLSRKHQRAIAADTSH